jgi:hypothetical protein
MLKYCNPTTISHPVSQHHPDCRCPIKRIIVNEGGKGHLFKDDPVLNLDQVEKKLAEGQRREKGRKTMDVFIGVSEGGRNKKIALVEFKFNVKNPNNLKREELEGKVKGSTDIIGSTIPIHNKYCFVFNVEIVKEATNRMYRILGAKLNYLAVTEAQLNEMYW